MHVIIDDREARSEVSTHLRKLNRTTVTIQRLSIGDYLVDDRLLVERKTCRDFALSLSDGRLFKQACRLLSSPYNPLYILENSGFGLKDLNVRRESIQGAIISLTLLLGIPLLRSQSCEETARLLFYASSQLQRTCDNAVQRPGYRPKGHRKRKLYVLQGLPGIGPVRAKQLLSRFGSIRGVVNADAEELIQIPGLSTKRIKSIQSILR